MNRFFQKSIFFRKNIINSEKSHVWSKNGLLVFSRASEAFNSDELSFPLRGFYWPGVGTRAHNLLGRSVRKTPNRYDTAQFYLFGSGKLFSWFIFSYYFSGLKFASNKFLRRTNPIKFLEDSTDLLSNTKHAKKLCRH
jgi:hypothetical protein